MAKEFHRETLTLFRSEADRYLRQSHPVPVQRRDRSCVADLALRVNPCPEVTVRTCRLSLRTLLYRLETVYLGNLLRIWLYGPARKKK